MGGNGGIISRKVMLWHTIKKEWIFLQYMLGRSRICTQERVSSASLSNCLLRSFV